jgi:hypothetical protein
MKAASRLAVDERRNHALDVRAATLDANDWRKYMTQLDPKPEP